MNIKSVMVLFVALSTIISPVANADDAVLLKAIYTPAKGADREYGQGAIERNDLRHSEIAANVWLILVDPPGSTEEWQERLDMSVEKGQGTFRVTQPSEEERRRVQEGKVHFQR